MIASNLNRYKDELEFNAIIEEIKRVIVNSPIASLRHRRARDILDRLGLETSD